MTKQELQQRNRKQAQREIEEQEDEGSNEELLDLMQYEPRMRRAFGEREGYED